MRAKHIILASTLLITTGAVNAQQDEKKESLSTLIISASKQNGSAFDIPSSVSVLKKEALDKLAIDDLSQIVNRVPNLYFTSFLDTQVTPTIRGLGFSDDESDSISNSIYLDSAPIGSMALGNLFDVEQVEILRGAQSTMYGQNSLGGIIAIRTIDPGFKRKGRIETSVASNNHYRTVLSGDLPLSEKTSVRLVVGGESTNGPVVNTKLNKKDTAGWDSVFGKLKLLHNDSYAGELKVTAQYFKNKGGSDHFTTQQLAAKHQSKASESGTNDSHYGLISAEYSRVLESGIQMQLNASGTTADWNYQMPFSVFNGKMGGKQNNKQFTAEARFSGLGEESDWLLAGYLASGSRTAPFVMDMSPYFFSDTTAKVKSATVAVFGEYGWQLDESLRFGAGARIEHNRRSFDWQSHQGRFGVPDVYSRLDNKKLQETVFLPKLTLEYSPNENHYSFATVGRGYKSSGFNLYALDQASAAKNYSAEYGQYVELGYRYKDDEERLTAEINLFYMQLQDQQVIIEGTGGLTLTDNAAKSHSTGVELSGSYKPVANLTISANAAWLQAEYDNYETGGVDFSSQQFPNSPEGSLGVGIDWQVSNQWNLSMSARRQGSSYLYPANSYKNSAYTLIDASLSYKADDWTVGLYGKNLKDAKYLTRALKGGNFVAGKPRELGMRLAYQF